MSVALVSWPLFCGRQLNPTEKWHWNHISLHGWNRHQFIRCHHLTGLTWTLPQSCVVGQEHPLNANMEAEATRQWVTCSRACGEEATHRVWAADLPALPASRAHPSLHTSTAAGAHDHSWFEHQKIQQIYWIELGLRNSPTMSQSIPKSWNWIT